MKLPFKIQRIIKNNTYQFVKCFVVINGPTFPLMINESVVVTYIKP